MRNDNTLSFQGLCLQLPSTRQRLHFVRCPVTVHQFSNGTLGVSYQGRLLARYDAAGQPLHPAANKVRATSAQRSASAGAGQRAATHLRTRIPNPHFFARAPTPGESAGEKMFNQPVTVPSQEVI